MLAIAGQRDGQIGWNWQNLAICLYVRMYVIIYVSLAGQMAGPNWLENWLNLTVVPVCKEVLICISYSWPNSWTELAEIFIFKGDSWVPCVQ